jgi:glutathione synthase/RimK-type ligase-like ATP-grasp enzyme
MNGWTLLADDPRKALFEAPGHTLLATRDYVARPDAVVGRRSRIVNLAGSYDYLGTGYYASLLAEARGHRMIPSVRTITELNDRSIYRLALPALEEDLNHRLRRSKQPLEAALTLLIAFGRADDQRFQAFGRRVFDRFRAPLLEVRIRPGTWTRVASIRAKPLGSLSPDGLAWFADAFARFTRTGWQLERETRPPRYTMAVLVDPREAMPPSDGEALDDLRRVAAEMGIAVEFVEKKDLPRLAEYDMLFIRQTTSIDDHTYRFAKKAEAEGLPVIDDPTSILRCTNKVYLWERLAANGIQTPKTMIVQRTRDLATVEDALKFPIILKIPDGSFSLGVKRADDSAGLKRLAREMLQESDVILAQEFMPTQFDWRVGVLDGEPLFVCQYGMAKGHWQIVNHAAAGADHYGGARTLAVEEAPPKVIETAVKAAKLIGRGLYGVDLKENSGGFYVIEVNDNPNLDRDVEDRVLGDKLWRRIIGWFLRRLEAH